MRQQFLKATGAFLPILGLGFYSWFVSKTCCEYIDASGRYSLPVMPFVPEDVLGFGFWPTWVIAFVVILGACGVAIRLSIRNRWYFIGIGVAFVAISSVDWHYADALKIQVLGT